MRETTSWNPPASTRQGRVDVDDCRRSPMAGSRRPDGALRQWENSEGGPQLGGRRCEGARWSVATRRTNDSWRFGRHTRKPSADQTSRGRTTDNGQDLERSCSPQRERKNAVAEKKGEAS